MKQRAVPAGKFKNSCLKLMDEVHDGGTPIDRRRAVLDDLAQKKISVDDAARLLKTLR